MKGYQLAYEGKKDLDGAEQPVVFVSDFSSDRQIGKKGRPVAGITGGKLLLAFGKLYKEHYMDTGKYTPIFTNAQDETSYNLLMRQMELLGKKLGCRFTVQEIGSHRADSSTMHDLLITPQPLLP